MFRSNKNNSTKSDATDSLSTLHYLRVEPQGSRFTRYKAAAVKRPIVSSLIALVGVLFVGASSIVPQMVRADSYDAQIQALQSENQQNNNAISDLANQATSYQDAISQLQAQISTIQSVISANEAKQADLQNQINANQAELDKQRKVLGENIKMTYVDGQPSTIEMLASSKNLSDFVDKEEYRTAVQNKIQATLKKIAELQNTLNSQKQEVETLLASQRSQQSQLDGARAQQAGMLAYNEAQQAAYNQKTKDNTSKIADLRRQQAIENARITSGNGSYVVAGDAGHGGYPSKWDAPVAQDSVLDNWGMYNRECVSYTAWKVYQSGRNMPYWGGYGNANQWDDNARAAGIPVDTNPRAGDVAIKNSGTYGHAMYVEKVFSDGSIYISQYNQDYQGHYSEAYISAASVQANNLQFIHFP
ncbi:MAG TPA: CHAP domain-containing protein [Candidatus Saccharimonadales bacterium]|nr:CHAP domain-containing protein [Candidatus Saccharimonadales bacterium]